MFTRITEKDGVFCRKFKTSSDIRLKLRRNRTEITNDQNTHDLEMTSPSTKTCYTFDGKIPMHVCWDTSVLCRREKATNVETKMFILFLCWNDVWSQEIVCKVFLPRVTLSSPCS